MWVRNQKTGSSEFVSDLTAAFAMIDAGEAMPVDALPTRPAEQPVVETPHPLDHDANGRKGGAKRKK